ncbi:hypothetical protein XENTR_v10011372 [Xenopus tropicalis]|nr:hypothetical protein XENTR_v10011372 [Xenopus tropicalis]
MLAQTSDQYLNTIDSGWSLNQVDLKSSDSEVKRSLDKSLLRVFLVIRAIHLNEKCDRRLYCMCVSVALHTVSGHYLDIFQCTSTFNLTLFTFSHSIVICGNFCI